MNLIEYKPSRQRDILKIIAEHLLQEAEDADDNSVETIVGQLEYGFFEPLSDNDFFGSEGWKSFLSIE